MSELRHELLDQAYERASELGINACPPDVGGFLRLLAWHIGPGRIAELGTGSGAGAAWIASGLRGDATFVTAELDSERVAAARSMLASFPGVTVLEGDWIDEVPGFAPFDLVYADGFRDYAEVNARAREVVELLRPGGLVVIDHQDEEILRGEVGEKPFPWPSVGVEVVGLQLKETVVALGARIE